MHFMRKDAMFIGVAAYAPQTIRSASSFFTTAALNSVMVPSYKRMMGGCLSFPVPSEQAKYYI